MYELSVNSMSLTEQQGWRTSTLQTQQEQQLPGTQTCRWSTSEVP